MLIVDVNPIQDAAAYQPQIPQNSSNSAIFSDIRLNLDIVVADIHLQHSLSANRSGEISKYCMKLIILK